MRYLAIDFGLKRTGLAVGDDQTGVVTPWGVVDTHDPERRQEELMDAIEQIGPAALVVGLPLNMDGSHGDAAARAVNFARRLEEATGLPVHLMDERLTSQAADQQLARTGLTHKQKKSRRDAVAAAAILRDFLARDR